MSGTWGNHIKYSIFGESHGEGIGIVIDRLPAGLLIDFEAVTAEMNRRRPGGTALGTPRNEADRFEVLSGVFKGRTSGAPLCALIRNTNQHSKDYEQLRYTPRPGHADYTAFIKHKGFHDYRGGGHFSGRLTAALVFAGAVAKQLLTLNGISIYSHIYQIGTLRDVSFLSAGYKDEQLSLLKASSFPVLNSAMAEPMISAIEEARAQQDSVGGIVEATVLGLPAGLGDPFFDSIESTLSHLLFSIPGVKGVEFGDGFSLAAMKGSQAKDEFSYLEGSVVNTANHNGGILGGITTGMPLVFKAAFKPTPSISQAQNTIRLNTFENTKIEIMGRHDPCIVPRALPVVEAVAAMAILDSLSLSKCSEVL